MKSKISSLLTLVLASAVLTVGAYGESAKIEITANDTMQYNSKAFEVKAGEEVTMTFKNLGKLPKAAMGHNVVVLKVGSNVAGFAASAISAAANDYIPTDDAQKALIVAHTKMLGPDETDTITFTLPAPGAYPFLCSFPGHFALMQGIITAK